MTKSAGTLIKNAFLLGTLFGGVTSSNLSDRQREVLRRHYGLEEDANLTLRNMGRGILGEYAGQLGGLAVFGLPLAYSAGRATPHVPSALLSGAGIVASPFLGSYLATRKYSAGNAKKVADDAAGKKMEDGNARKG